MHRARVVVLLVLPLFAVPVLVARWADEQAARIGAGLARATEALTSTKTPPAERDRDLVTDWRAELGDLWDELNRVPAGAASSPPARAARMKANGSRGIHVGARKVLELAERGARPSGIFVAAEGPRPAGLMLLGVSGFGLGLRDGDILTHAAGQRATSEGQVVGLVLSARGARQARIGGRIWRDGVSFPLLVDQPYVPAREGKALTRERAENEPAARSDGTG